MERPPVAFVEDAYDELFRSTLDKLRDLAILGRLFQSKQHGEGVPGRSISWKLFLTHQPPLTSSLNPYPVAPLDSLRNSRDRYVQLLKEKLRAPDGSYEEGFTVPGEKPHERLSSSRSTKKPDDLTLNNPLSLDSSNPWHAYFSALELRDTIRQDVERTFPEVPYFRSSTVQHEMTHILFLHVSERENIGYRQGMHELLACVYHAVDFDSIEKGSDKMSSTLEELCDRTFVAADAFALFEAIMERMEYWYEWRPPILDPVSPVSPVPHVTHFSANGEIVLRPQIDILANGQMDLKPYVAPIVPTCASLRDEKLKAVDPHLWGKLREGGVEPQMYGMRWLRLLFTREFSMAESMVIWDGLFASISEEFISPSTSSSISHKGFELALWISVAMLIRIRNNLIPGDYTAQLTQLLRYPAPRALGGSSDVSNAPALLLSQAQLLMTSPTPATGASLVMQNRNELGIPVEPPEPPEPSPSRRRRRASATAPPTVSASQTRTSHHPDRPRLQDMIANRLMDANESFGIQRGIFGTIAELRKNLPDLSQSLMRTPSWNGSSISLNDERGGGSRSARSPNVPEIIERPPWEPKPRSEIEHEIAELRALLKTLGKAVGWAVDVLLLDEDGRDPTDGEKPLREKKAEAVECMAYVRDVLARGGQGEIDEERLVSEEEYQRQRKIELGKNAAATAQPPQSKPLLPPPRAAPATDPSDNMTKPRIILSSRDSTRPMPSLTKTTIPPYEPPKNSSTTSSTPAVRPVHAFHPRTEPPLASASAPPSRMVVPPWQHTPSNFSNDSPYASGSLPRFPPPSTIAPPRSDSRSSEQSRSQTSPNDHDLPRADPLGVLRGPT